MPYKALDAFNGSFLEFPPLTHPVSYKILVKYRRDRFRVPSGPPANPWMSPGIHLKGIMLYIYTNMILYINYNFFKKGIMHAKPKHKLP